MKKQLTTKRIVMIALFTALIAVGAFIRIDTPVMSFTLQFLFVIAAGLILGKIDGPISVVVYIVLGLIGLPVFARGGGVAYVLQPSFGYILAFVLSAYICGRLSEKGASSSKKDFQKMVCASLVALVVEYGIGMAYYWALSTFYFGQNLELKQLMMYCVILVLPGDFLSCLIAAAVSKRIKILQ